MATDQDYKAQQREMYANFNQQKQQFFARGHLTPNADFNTDAEREYTMITTNIAPQWQLFNAGNWANLEKALRNYATQTTHPLYVFTGTGKVLKLFQQLLSCSLNSCKSGRLRFFRAQTHTDMWYEFG